MTPRPRPKRPGLFVFVALAFAALLLGCSSDGAATDSEVDDNDGAWAGFERTPNPDVSELSLPAVTSEGEERAFNFTAAENELLLVYFGFTTCPDVCPTTLADVARARGSLGDDATRVELAMVTIDPEIDTPEVLNAYASAFVPGAVALRSTDDTVLRPVADVFGVEYGKEDDGTVFHTGSLFAVDDAGRLRRTWPFGISSDDLERDFARLLAETGLEPAGDAASSDDDGVAT